MFWALTYLIRRLKGILNNMAAGNDDSATSVIQRSSRKGADAKTAPGRQSQKEPRKRKRKRSRSVPNIQVKIAEKRGAEESKAATAEAKLEPSLVRIVRAATMDTSRAKGRKKSLASGGSSGFKHFKNFVESKILSKSSHDVVVVNGNGAEGSSGVGAGAGGLRAAGGSAKDSFQRRSSRTSVAEFDPLLASPTGNNREVVFYV